MIAGALFAVLRAQCPTCHEPDGDAICIPCPVGWYKPQAAQTDCQPCPPNIVCPDCTVPPAAQQKPLGALAEASAQSAQQPQQAQQQVCVPGKYINTQGTPCTACPSRRFCPGDGKSYYCPPGTYGYDGAAACGRCPAGTYTATYGGKRCLPCPSGQLCALLPASLPPAEEAVLLFGAQQLGALYTDTTQLALTDTITHKNATTNALYVIGYSSKLNRVVALFRGPVFSKLQTLLLGADIAKVSYPNCPRCQVHQGFFRAYKSLQAQFLSNMQFVAQLHPNAPVVVTGHSSGAAMAVFAALDLERNNFPLSLYTFGSPRVGNSQFARYANSKISNQHWRVTYKNDPVAQLPLGSMGYLHAGTELNFQNFVDYTVQPLFLDRMPPRHDPLHILDHQAYKSLTL